MIHTVFWLTGAVTWGLIALGGAMFLFADLHDRAVMRRARNGGTDSHMARRLAIFFGCTTAILAAVVVWLIAPRLITSVFPVSTHETN
jgi:hypothetical protein